MSTPFISLIFIVSILLIVMFIVLIRIIIKERKSSDRYRKKHTRNHGSNWVAKTCPECGKIVHSKDLFCGDCGSSLTDKSANKDFIGSRWQLKDSSTVVTFLEDGDLMFEFNKANMGSWKRPGKWKMENDRLLFDCNTFTKYDVEMRDERMTGTCTQISSNVADEHSDTEFSRI